jgi:transcription initiation factor TFIIB
MRLFDASVKTVSDVQPSDEEDVDREVREAHAPAGRSACPECDGRVITEDEVSFCADCGLVATDEWVDRSPTLRDLGKVGDAEASIETVDPFRTDKGLHTRIGKSTDGHGNHLSTRQWERAKRLRKCHRRYRFGARRKRTKRLNEALRDVEMIGANLGLPDHVVTLAARYLRSGAAAELPGGRMAWEALAGGAVLLAVRASPVDRDGIDVAVARHAKASHERVCAAARKLRCELGFDAPVIRPDAVMRVVDTLADDAIPGARAIRTWRLAQHLMELGDRVPVGPGTPRLTVAAAALYAADRLLPGKHLTQAQVVEVASTVVTTSTHRLSRYSRELVDAYEAEHGTDDPGVGLETERETLR